MFSVFVNRQLLIVNRDRVPALFTLDFLMDCPLGLITIQLTPS